MLGAGRVTGRLRVAARLYAGKEALFSAQATGIFGLSGLDAARKVGARLLDAPLFARRTYGAAAGIARTGPEGLLGEAITGFGRLSALAAADKDLLGHARAAPVAGRGAAERLDAGAKLLRGDLAAEVFGFARLDAALEDRLAVVKAGGVAASRRAELPHAAFKALVRGLAAEVFGLSGLDAGTEERLGVLATGRVAGRLRVAARLHAGKEALFGAQTAHLLGLSSPHAALKVGARLYSALLLARRTHRTAAEFLRALAPLPLRGLPTRTFGLS
jgi:hypothetical protein